LIATGFIAILYRYWLITPVLQYLSFGQWLLVAIVIAAASGVALALLRLPILALACGSVAGLVLGGTWAAWQAPSDASISVSAAFALHLKSFWWEVMLLTVTATVAGLCSSALARRRFLR
jgi:hypothetical protein